MNAEAVVGSRDNQYRDRVEVHAEGGRSPGVPASVSEAQDRKGKFSVVPTEMIEPPHTSFSLDTLGGSLLEAAIAYVQRGWPVLPVQPHDKVPLGSLAPHGLKDATLDQRQIEKWWRSEPEANVGLVTGVAFDVLDIDGPTGFASITAARPLDAPTIAGPSCATGGGGAHVYVAVTGHGNRVRLLPGVDWRGHGGYAIAPPSIHASGALYQWRSGRSPGDQGVREAPAWLLDLLDRPSMNPVASIDLARGRRLAQAGGAYGRRALEIEADRVAHATRGIRNDQLNRSAFAIGQLISGGEILDAESAIRALMGAGLDAGLSFDEVTATVRSGIRGGSLRPRQAPRRVAS